MGIGLFGGQALRKTDIYADFHVHTHISPCGTTEATAKALIHRAEEKGFAAIGFADHFTPQPVPGCAFYDSQRIDVLTKLREELANMAPSPALDVLVGVEADYTLAGGACLDEEALRECDHIIGAASHFHLPAAPAPVEDTPAAKADLIIHEAREMLALPGITVWAHPFDCSSMRPLAPIMAEISIDTLALLIASANQHKVAVEINGGAGLSEEYREVTVPFFQMAREMGARFTLTSDAHHPDSLDRLDLALDWAATMGFCVQDFLPADELRVLQQSKVDAYFAGKQTKEPSTFNSEL
jgi:histidinol phosphatase-like PHP family hydrolase